MQSLAWDTIMLLAGEGTVSHTSVLYSTWPRARTVDRGAGPPSGPCWGHRSAQRRGAPCQPHLSDSAHMLPFLSPSASSQVSKRASPPKTLGRVFKVEMLTSQPWVTYGRVSTDRALERIFKKYPQVIWCGNHWA